jgi:GT2 family glycosyltransferase
LVSVAEKLQLIALYGDEFRRELLMAHTYMPVDKDILIVTHDELERLRRCIESVRQHTENYKIYVWDNASGAETQEWLRSQPDLKVTRSETNEGFIVPNNRLIAQGDSPYVILLNNDTEVHPGWDKAMVGYLQATGAAQVGYVGGWLNEEGRGYLFGFGSDVHYIPGWCFAIPRAVYLEFGLFDEETFRFAYCEDADFSLRLTNAGWEIRALHLDLVTHHENTTIKKVHELRDCRSSFDENHAALRQRWGHRFNSNPCGASV